VHGFGGSIRWKTSRAWRSSCARGTTAFQPTLFPAAPSVLGEQCLALQKDVAKLGRGCGARIVGLHLEGPFVNPLAAARCPASDLCEPSRDALRAILGSSSGDGRGVRTMTIAPELAGSATLIQELVQSGIRPSLVTAARAAAQARNAATPERAARRHLFTPCPRCTTASWVWPVSRSPTPALFAEIIAISRTSERKRSELALRARSPRGLCLVSDALSGAGTGCDVFHSHGREHLVREARLVSAE